MKSVQQPASERADVPSFWRCDCGYSIGAHREWCPCGRHRSETKTKEAKK